MIEGLRGKEPVGAVLTIGTKGPSGAPTDRDRFYIKVPDSSGDVRVPHPSFASYNFYPPAPDEWTAEQKAQYREREHAKRRNIRGVLVHAEVDECFEWTRKAQKLPRPYVNHSKLPACTGDGRKALRLQMAGDMIGHKEIPCPNELCEFAIAPNERTPPCCKPWGRLLFQPTWQDGSKLPTPLMKLTTQSWHSLAAILGFFDYFRKQAALCGVPGAQLFGLPFELTLTEKSSPEKRTKFPVLRMTPLAQIQAFLIGQGDRVAQLQLRRPYVALLDAPEQDPGVLLADRSTIEPGQPRVQP